MQAGTKGIINGWTADCRFNEALFEARQKDSYRNKLRE